MNNVKLTIQDNILMIEIDLTAEGHLSKSLKSIVVASTGGNVPLIDSDGYRPEKLNLSLSKPIPKEDL